PPRRFCAAGVAHAGAVPHGSVCLIPLVHRRTVVRPDMAASRCDRWTPRTRGAGARVGAAPAVGLRVRDECIRAAASLALLVLLRAREMGAAPPQRLSRAPAAVVVALARPAGRGIARGP